MGCKRALLSWNEPGKAAAIGDEAAEQGGASRNIIAGRTRVGPSEDTLQRVLPLLLEHVQPEWVAQCAQVCKIWRVELEARGFCNKTVQLCLALVESGNAGRLYQNAHWRLDACNGETLQTQRLDANAFLEKGLLGLRVGKGTLHVGLSLHEGLQAASQEPDASFLSRGSASAAQCLGLPLVQWAGKPQGRYPGSAGWPSGHDGGEPAIAFSPDGKHIVSGSDDQLVKIWNAETGAEVCTMEGHAGEVFSVAFARDGKRIVSGSGDGLVKIWDAETNTEVCTLVGHSGEVNSVAFSPNGKHVISGSDDQRVKIWNAAPDAEVCTIDRHMGNAWSAAFSLDGKLVVTGTGYMVKIWNAETGAEMCSLEGHAGIVFFAAFSPDGKRVVSGGDDRAVKIWNVETGTEIVSLGGHNGAGICLCTVDEDGYLEDDDDFEAIIHPGCPVSGHTGPVKRVQFSADGAHVVSASEDNTVRVWDVASGRQVCSLPGGEFALVWGASGERKRARHVLTASGDMLRIYDVAKGQPPAEDGAAAPVALGAVAPGTMAPRVGVMAPVACFKAPQKIESVQCYGAAICVGCYDGAVCVLSAPFLAV